jgi:hypothetical protein
VEFEKRPVEVRDFKKLLPIVFEELMKIHLGSIKKTERSQHSGVRLGLRNTRSLSEYAQKSSQTPAFASFESSMDWRSQSSTLLKIII